MKPKQPETIMCQDYIEHKVHHWAKSNISIKGIREKDKIYAVITNLRSKRIKYVDDDRVVRSTDKKYTFDFININ
jgi:hypothetical protein